VPAGALARRRIAELEKELRELRAQTDVFAGGDSLDVLLLRTARRLLALPLACVAEVIPRVLLVRAPQAAAASAGHMRWRGQQVEVIDLAARWTHELIDTRLEDRIVVVRTEGATFGILVPEVLGVDTLRREELQPLDSGPREAIGVAERAGEPVLLLTPDSVCAP
jgi:purine-binding chemotaxis protein CheW